MHIPEMHKKKNPNMLKHAIRWKEKRKYAPMCPEWFSLYWRTSTLLGFKVFLVKLTLGGSISLKAFGL